VVGESFTIDHVIPRIKGGDDDFENLALCCYVCNPLKGAHNFEADSLYE